MYLLWLWVINMRIEFYYATGSITGILLNVTSINEAVVGNGYWCVTTRNPETQDKTQHVFKLQEKEQMKIVF